ncbi:MAG: uracil-DNA glycosylase [Acidimicrobiia bacterium]|nr:uracil-DNA glycosylase [Acidimicrobiia bacterium]MDH3469745.1 uracil-DNA glycosylase [Acidimicrobiia bacterium]
MASPTRQLEGLNAQVIECRRCPRLVEWRERVSIEKRASFIGHDYWGKPVPGFGDPNGAVLVLGLAPAAHGANRTGRMFTGDRSGDWLYRAMYRAGFANQETSVSAGDGLKLKGAYVTAPVRCAPPANKPTSAEHDNCAPWLDAELDILDGISVAVCLGQIAYVAALAAYQRRGVAVPRPRVKFGHGVEVRLSPQLTLLTSFHPSQQNTFTGRLTESMLDDVFQRAKALASPRTA